MSAVVSFVSNVIEDVVDAVGDVVEAVGDVVEKAVDFVGDAVQKVIEDPLPVLLSVAGSFVGIPPMVTSAAITAARGGDLEDIVLSAGTAYLAPTATNAISSTLSSTLGEVVADSAVANVVVDGVSKGLVNGTIAEVRGGDFEDGFAGAFTGTIVNSGVGEFTNEFVKPGVVDMLADSGLDQSTVNQIVTGGTKAVSAGLTAEITGKGSFDTAFLNSVQNTTINAGTNFAVNTIGDQFRTAETGLTDLKEEKKDGTELDSLDDYFSLDTTRDTDSTGAGVSDDIVDLVEVADTGLDTGNATDTLSDTSLSGGDLSSGDQLDTSLADTGDFSASDASNFGSSSLGATSNIDSLLAGSDAEEIIDEFGGDDTDDTESSVTVTSLPSDLQDIYDQYTSDTRGITKSTGDTSSQDTTSGGLNTVKKATDTTGNITDEDIVFSGGKADIDAEDSLVDTSETPSAKKTTAVDPYAGIDEGVKDLSEDSVIDVTGRQGPTIIDGGLNAVTDLAGKTGLVDTSGLSTDKIITGALNQVLKPAIRTGLTKVIKGTPTKTLVKKPVAKKSPLTALQVQQARGATQPQKAPRTIDMSKVVGAPTAKVAPPKKVDVKTLTPIHDVASLTSILSGGKG